MTLIDFTNKQFDELVRHKPIGTASYWFRIALVAIPFACFIYSLFLTVIAGTRIWLLAIGGEIISCSILLILACIGSFVLLIIVFFNKTKDKQPMFVTIYILCTVGCFILLGSLLSQTNMTKAETTTRDMQDFCFRKASNGEVVAFLKTHSTPYSVNSYVQYRTSDQHHVISAFLGIWIAVFLLYIFTLILLENEDKLFES